MVWSFETFQSVPVVSDSGVHAPTCDKNHETESQHNLYLSICYIHGVIEDSNKATAQRLMKYH